MRVLNLKRHEWFEEEREPIDARSKPVALDLSKCDMVKDCPKFMKPKDVAKLLDFSIYTIYGWMRGPLRSISIGGRKRIRREDLAEFLIKENL